MNYKEYFELSPEELFDILTDTFQVNLPPNIETVDQLEEAGRLLGHIAGNFQFLNTLLSYSKLQCRQTKRDGNRNASEDAIDRREIISNLVDSTQMQYKALSRMITVKQESNREMQINNYF